MTDILEENDDNRCPHCNARMVHYRQSLTKGLVSCLWKLYVTDINNPGEPVYMKDLGLSNPQYTGLSKLQYWSLAEMAGLKGTGLWRITPAGIRFCEGLLSVQKYAWTYRGEFEKFDGPQVSISEIFESDDEFYERDPEFKAVG